MLIRGAELGGAKPFFCVPLVASDLNQLLSQARTAKEFEADVVEWRVDAYGELSDVSIVEGAQRLRSVLDRVPILFTIRIRSEGGAKEIDPAVRARCIDAVLHSQLVDLVDVELCNGQPFIERVVATANEHQIKVLLSFHDFSSTPGNHELLEKISSMIQHHADIAKIACMPKDRNDVLRLLQVTLEARHLFPGTPLCTISMGSLGTVSRVAGFLYGSDMTFAVGQEMSAPGQIPIREARALTEGLLRYE